MIQLSLFDTITDEVKLSQEWILKYLSEKYPVINWIVCENTFKQAYYKGVQCNIELLYKKENNARYVKIKTQKEFDDFKQYIETAETVSEFKQKIITAVGLLIQYGAEYRIKSNKP